MMTELYWILKNIVRKEEENILTIYKAYVKTFERINMRISLNLTQNQSYQSSHGVKKDPAFTSGMSVMQERRLANEVSKLLRSDLSLADLVALKQNAQDVGNSQRAQVVQAVINKRAGELKA